MQIIPLRAERPAFQPSPMRLARACDVSVIVPALNEAMNLPALFSRIDAAMAGRSYEIILVDDDSKDETPETCRILADKLPVRLIVRRDPLGGLSGAVLHGMALSRGDFLVVMDADLQHPPEAIPQLIAAIESGDSDFALGSRYIAGGRTQEGWGFFRKLNSLAATVLARPISGGVRDPMSGFFALRATTYRRAARLTPLGYKIALELMCKCRIERICEVPIEFANRAEGESKLSLKQQLRFLRHLARLYAFAYPKTVRLTKLAVGAALGWSFALATNPQMSGVLAVWYAVAGLVLTRSQPGRVAPTRELASAEVTLTSLPPQAAAVAA
jgi:dolichol-phosphate mannosyltransferase